MQEVRESRKSQESGGDEDRDRERQEVSKDARDLAEDDSEQSGIIKAVEDRIETAKKDDLVKI